MFYLSSISCYWFWKAIFIIHGCRHSCYEKKGTQMEIYLVTLFWWILPISWYAEDSFIYLFMISNIHWIVKNFIVCNFAYLRRSILKGLFVPTCNTHFSTQIRQHGSHTFSKASGSTSYQNSLTWNGQEYLTIANVSMV